MPTTTSRWALRSPLGTDPADAPLHIGNLAADTDGFAKDLQGLLSARPVAAAGNYGLYYWATDAKVLYRSDGAAWVPFGQQPTLVTTPPASPVEGQEIYLSIDGSQGIVWHMRWRASTSRWDFVGGAPQLHEVDGGAVDNTASVFSDLAGGPTITVARAGDYDLEFSALAVAAPSIAYVWQIGLNIGGVSPPVDLTSQVANPNPAGATVAFQLSRRVRRTLAAGAVLKVQYLVVGSPATFSNRTLRATPFRVQ